jgi:hypothetical protein
VRERLAFRRFDSEEFAQKSPPFLDLVDQEFLRWDAYYATFPLRETGIEQVWTVGSLVICVATVAHGMIDTPH